MKGRKPVPTALVELHGRPNKNWKEKPYEPKPVGDLSIPPEWMTDAQKESWAYALQHSPRGLLKMIDRGILAGWVVAEDLHRQASTMLTKSTILVRPSTDPENMSAPIQNPLIGTINRQFGMMLKAAGELGFSPVSRPRIEYTAEAGIGNVIAAPIPATQQKGTGRRTVGDKVVPLREFLANAPR